MSEQPDLFGEFDAAKEREVGRQAASAHAWTPHRCPSCGTVEPNSFALRLNHGYECCEPGMSGFPFGEHPNYGADCIAQSLTRSHVFVGRRDGWPDLDRYLARAAELGLSL